MPTLTPGLYVDDDEFHIPIMPLRDVAGPFYFAWMFDDSEEFGVQHHVMGEYIFAFEKEQSEGNHASLSIEVENPGSSLLAPGRPLWCFFAWDNPETETVEPLFKGRLIAVPKNILGRVVTLQFVARPEDFEDAKEEIAADIRYEGAPFWDAVFIADSRLEDASAVLEALPMLWHTDSVTLETTLSDINVGEDGTVNFEEGEAFDDGLEADLSGSPLTAVEIDATVNWKQTHAGEFVVGRFHFGGHIDGLASDWPKAGASLSGGYHVTSSRFSGGRAHLSSISFNYTWQSKKREHRNGDLLSVNHSYNGPGGQPGGAFVIFRNEHKLPNEETGQGEERDVQTGGVTSGSGQGWAVADLSLGYGANRDRSERLNFIVRSDVQEVLRTADDEEVPEKVQVNGRNVGEIIPGETVPPILDYASALPVFTLPPVPGRRWRISSGSGVPQPVVPSSYFRTARGNLSAQYLIMIAVARLKLGARIVQVKWACDFLRATEFSCRKNASLFDERLSNGHAVGKIISYKLKGDGDTGVFEGGVTIGCTVGLGNAIEEVEGDPVYAAPGYMARGYQAYEGEVISIGAGDIGYSPPIFINRDDGVKFPLTAGAAVVRAATSTVTLPGKEDVQEHDWDVGGAPDPVSETIGDGAISSRASAAIANSQAAAQARAEREGREVQIFTLELKSLEGLKFDAEATMLTTNLVLPKQYTA